MLPSPESATCSLWAPRASQPQGAFACVRGPAATKLASARRKEWLGGGPEPGYKHSFCFSFT